MGNDKKTMLKIPPKTKRTLYILGLIILWDLFIIFSYPFKETSRFFIRGLSFITTFFAILWVIREYGKERIFQNPSIKKNITEFLVASFPLRRKRGKVLLVSPGRSLGKAIGKKFPKASIDILPIPIDLSLYDKEKNDQKSQYDGMISNYGFYPIIEKKNGEELILQWLELLKPSGVFLIHDLFYDKRFYQNPKEFINRLEDLGFKKVRMYPTVDGKILTLKEARKGDLLGSGILVGIK
ncbi:MAG: hypothetical protein Q4Q07_06885 [Tissierellia bacterium]|nr:hypothetical protein [Tissierellia bacterium]